MIDLGAANLWSPAQVMRCLVKRDLAPELPVNPSTTAPSAAAFAIEARPPSGVTDTGSEKTANFSTSLHQFFTPKGFNSKARSRWLCGALRGE